MELCMNFRFKKLICFFLFIFSILVLLFADENPFVEKKTIVPSFEQIIDSSNQLHFYIWKDENLEHLVLNNSAKKNETKIIHNSAKKTTRLFYDSNHKLTCSEFWTIGKTSSESFLEKIIYYFYSDGNLHEELNMQTYFLETKEFDVKKKKYFQTFYDSQNKVLEKNEYSIIMKDENEKINFTKSYKEIDFPIRKDYSFFYKYDKDSNILQEEEIHQEYKTEFSMRPYKTNTRKNVYEYLENDCPPSISFYENSILRMKTVYSAQKDYIQNIYFDNQSYIRIQVVAGKRVSEIYYVNGVAYE